MNHYESPVPQDFSTSQRKKSTAPSAPWLQGFPPGCFPRYPPAQRAGADAQRTSLTAETDHPELQLIGRRCHGIRPMGSSHVPKIPKESRYFYQNHHDTCFELHGHFELHEKKCRLAVE